MSEFAGNLPRKFISCRHLGFESSAYKFLEERESENPQNVVERDEANTVEIGETSASPAKSLCSLQDAPVRVECIGQSWGMKTAIWPWQEMIAFWPVVTMM